ncbi:hypothetical protein BDW74DRAFT_164237 [Aspergillus multicolor]|uniref:uncharacterized protein n=1 Tax=Aspergillus multicolor TaxID=41759 RepID=UPI003CCE47B4
MPAMRASQCENPLLGDRPRRFIPDSLHLSSPNAMVPCDTAHFHLPSLPYQGASIMPDPNDMVLIALAQKITEATQVITNFASANQLAFSLDSQSDPQDPAAISAPGSQAYHEARMAALEASSTLSALLSGTQTSFLDLCSHFHAASALRIVLKFNIAHAVPLQGSTSYGQVAQKSGLDTRTVQRILCFLMGYHIFRQPAPGRVAHSRLSQAMVSHEGLAALVQFSFGELYGYSYHMADALAKWGSSQEPNETGFNIAEDTTDGLYAFTDRQCGKARQSAFSTMMDLVASSELSSSDALFGALDWQGLGDAVVVDVRPGTYSPYTTIPSPPGHSHSHGDLRANQNTRGPDRRVHRPRQPAARAPVREPPVHRAGLCVRVRAGRRPAAARAARPHPLPGEGSLRGARADPRPTGRVPAAHHPAQLERRVREADPAGDRAGSEARGWRPHRAQRADHAGGWGRHGVADDRAADSVGSLISYHTPSWLTLFDAYLRLQLRGWGSCTDTDSRFTDMTMLCNFNGQERTAEQFDALVRGVDPRLRIVQMRSPSALATGVIEIAWE